ncbi:MAG: hypothetical protein OXN86_08365 [Chloroflexota bacterium]|nr:hypothetical protein [Chloroflexota bacterium]
MPEPLRCTKFLDPGMTCIQHAEIPTWRKYALVAGSVIATFLGVNLLDPRNGLDIPRLNTVDAIPYVAFVVVYTFIATLAGGAARETVPAKYIAIGSGSVIAFLSIISRALQVLRGLQSTGGIG